MYHMLLRTLLFWFFPVTIKTQPTRRSYLLCLLLGHICCSCRLQKCSNWGGLEISCVEFCLRWLIFKMTIEIVDFPIKNGEFFHSYVNLPKGSWRQILKFRTSHDWFGFEINSQNMSFRLYKLFIAKMHSPVGGAHKEWDVCIPTNPEFSTEASFNTGEADQKLLSEIWNINHSQ